MSNQILETGPVPEIYFDQALGDLQARGWEEPRLSIQAEPETLQLEQQDDVIHLSCQSDCELRLPVGATLRIGEVNGDLSLKLLEDQLIIGEVRGDLVLRNVATTQIHTVHGDLAVKNASDDLHVDLVYGDADIRQVAGQCVLNEVRGDLDLANVDGDVQANVQGNARLRLSELSGTDYKVRAAGDIYCYLADDADAQIRLTSEGERIKVRLPQGSNTFRQMHHELTLGEGAVSLTLDAGGAIYLFVEKAGWGEVESPYGFPSAATGVYGQQIAQQVEAQMAEMARRLNEQMEHLTNRLGKFGLTPEESERIAEQARRVGEREASRAQEKLRRAQEKLERKLEAQRRRAEQRAQTADRRSRRHTWSFEWPAPPTPPPSPKSASTEEERLMILRMLEQKKITLEQADQLLSALEGEE